MKYTLLLLLLTGCAAIAQKKTYMLSDTPIQIDSATGGMIYTEVVRVDSATQDQLYSRAKSFITRAFNNESTVTQSDDKANGVVTGRGKLTYKLPLAAMALVGAYQMYYEMVAEIRVKDGRYRYEFSNLEFVSNNIRVRIDDELRKHPDRAEKIRTKPMTQREYDRYMGDKNPVMAVIRDMKNTMNPAKSKNDF